MVTIHFVYPHGSKISCPDAIGRNLTMRLKKHYNVINYDWDSRDIIRPGTNDILLGHPHPMYGTIFRRSSKLQGWKRVIWLLPFAHGKLNQISFLDPLIKNCDLYLAISGNYWFSALKKSWVAHWEPKMIRLDLAIDRTDFPVIKNKFNVQGQRRFLYIGNSGIYKNTDYLSEIAVALPETQISWIGQGKKIANLRPLGFQDFSTEKSKKIVSKYDFMITVGNSDANPTTILEAMSWGLIPVCTPQSGYEGFPGIINIPIDNIKKATEVINQLQMMDDEKLRSMQVLNWEILSQHFNWDRFTTQVIEALESSSSPNCLKSTFLNNLNIRFSEIFSPYSNWNPRNWLKLLSS